MAAEQENSEQAAVKQRRKKTVLAGAAVLLVLLGVIIAYVVWGRQAPAQEGDTPVIGMLDMQQLIKAHPDYEKLQKVQQEIVHLENSLALEDLKLQLPQPQVDDKLFQEAAQQKTRLDQLERHGDLVKQLNELAEKKRQELKPQFDAERSAASQPYLNEILNLRIKTDSADVLGLSQEQVQEMLNRIDELQRQRDQVLSQLSQEQEQRFKEIMAEEAAEPMAELKRLNEQEKQQTQQAELDKELAVQTRNAQALEQAVSPVEQKISTAKKKTLLEARKIQAKQIQDKIYSDIAGRAAKLAILHKLTLILSEPADNIQVVEPGISDMSNDQLGLRAVIGIDILDLTEEMLQEMQQHPFQPIDSYKQ